METKTLQKAKIYHKITGHEYFILSDGSFRPFHWFYGNRHKIYDIIDSTGNGSSLNKLLNNIEKSKT